MNFPVDNTAHVLSQLVAGGIKRVPRDSLGRGLQKLVSEFLQTSPHEAFPFADFALHPFNGNHSHEYNCKLSPESS